MPARKTASTPTPIPDQPAAPSPFRKHQRDIQALLLVVVGALLLFSLLYGGHTLALGSFLHALLGWDAPVLGIALVGAGILTASGSAWAASLEVRVGASLLVGGSLIFLGLLNGSSAHLADGGDIGNGLASGLVDMFAAVVGNGAAAPCAYALISAIHIIGFVMVTDRSLAHWGRTGRRLAADGRRKLSRPRKVSPVNEANPAPLLEMARTNRSPGSSAISAADADLPGGEISPLSRTIASSGSPVTAYPPASSPSREAPRAPYQGSAVSQPRSLPFRPLSPEKTAPRPISLDDPVPLPLIHKQDSHQPETRKPEDSESDTPGPPIHQPETREPELHQEDTCEQGTQHSEPFQAECPEQDGVDQETPWSDESEPEIAPEEILQQETRQQETRQQEARQQEARQEEKEIVVTGSQESEAPTHPQLEAAESDNLLEYIDGQRPTVIQAKELKPRVFQKGLMSALDALLPPGRPEPGQRESLAGFLGLSREASGRDVSNPAMTSADPLPTGGPGHEEPVQEDLHAPGITLQTAEQDSLETADETMDWPPDTSAMVGQESYPNAVSAGAPVDLFAEEEPEEELSAPASSRREILADSPTSQRPVSHHQAPIASHPSPGERTVDTQHLASAAHSPSYTPRSQGSLPPSSLLAPTPPPLRKSQDEALATVLTLERTLQEFKVEAKVVEIAEGPTLTRYEIQLAPGILVKKILSLADNIAMALAAIDVRVEAPIPGKSAIGVEVPKRTRGLVGLRELVDTPEFRNASPLTFALGRDVTGAPQYADLARMPHLLIAGSTGAGKSACLNALITSLLYRCQPGEVQFMMIDPKRVELSLYDGIPHLCHQIVRDCRRAPQALGRAMAEMDRRYLLLQEARTRDITGYNNKVGTPERRLPYIVVVIDELADLMMTSGAETEHSITRLAQLARAVGIHLVVATQRPSVDIVTGKIKANVSSRIAFAVSSGIDSRTILDCHGAERLIGRGDMLFLPIDSSKPRRIQGAFIGELEVEQVVEFWKSTGRPDFYLERTPAPGAECQANGDAEDELYSEAVRVVINAGQASTSMLQRRLKIGYNRAATLIELMEDNGVVGPQDGVRPREVLVSRDQWELSQQVEL